MTYPEKTNVEVLKGNAAPVARPSDNNFIWPDCGTVTDMCRMKVSSSDTCLDDSLSTSQPLRGKISSAAKEILDIRQRYLDADSTCSLATLYDPLTMPPELVKAHAKLDALVDKAYGRTFANDAERVAHLFNLYAEAAKAEKDAK